MNKGCIYHILGSYQTNMRKEIDEFKNILCSDFNATIGNILVSPTESKKFENFSMVFYFDNISKKDLKIKLNEKFGELTVAFIGYSFEIIEI